MVGFPLPWGKGPPKGARPSRTPQGRLLSQTRGATGAIAPASAAPLARPLTVLSLATFSFTALALTASAAGAASSSEAKERATVSYTEVEAASRGLTPPKVEVVVRTPTKLLAEAELHLRTKQLAPAIDKLNLVLELAAQGRASSAVAAEAQFLLGEAYFEDGQLYSARRMFRLVTDGASGSDYAAFGGRAGGRLVDIALQTHRQDTLPDVLARIERMRATSASDTLLYARAKALLALGRHAEASDQVSALIGATSSQDELLVQRALYLKGTALMKAAQAAASAASGDVAGGVASPESGAEEADASAAIERSEKASDQAVNYADAIAQFERAAGMSVAADAVTSGKVRDLSWLAVGRLHYESRQFLRATQAFSKIHRSSEFFPRALFESAWAYVQMGDYHRGRQALDVLAVLDPGLIDGADAALLRADLLLRAGRFKDAEAAYDEARATYDPLRRQMQDYLAANTDPAVYYDKLTMSDIEGGHELPAVVVGWAREEAEEDRVFSVVDEVARSRDLVARSRRVVLLLRSALGSGARAKIFPELRLYLEKVLGLSNQLGLARLALARGLDEESGSASGELGAVRQKRQLLMARLGEIPTKPGDFSIREARSEKAWNSASQSIQRLQLEADYLQALVNGLRQVLADSARYGVQISADARERFQLEMTESEQALSEYRKEISALRGDVEVGRAQSGFGDERFDKDEEVRLAFRELFEQEVRLTAEGADGDSDAVKFAKEIQPLLTNISVLERKLDAERARLNEQVKVQSQEVLAVVASEAQAVERYAAELDTLDESARLLVGEVARDNFERVRVRLKNVVMRADVGLVQKSWEVREQQRYRVRELLRERAREERVINDELQEVLDDSEDVQ